MTLMRIEMFPLRNFGYSWNMSITMRGHSVNTRKDELDRGDNEICLKDEFREGDPKFIVLSEVSMGTGSSLGLDGEE